MTPLISVIVPVNNVEGYLPDCLQSISGQTFSGPKEIILINDGSTDGSGIICKAFCEKHPEALLIEQENKGLSEARNVGIEAARGKWIYFLDSDDRLAPNALGTLFDYAEEQGCDMVIGSFFYDYESYLLYDDCWFQNNPPFVIDREEAMKQLILQKYFKNFAWGKLYHSELIRDTRFRPGVFFEDVYWQHLIVDKCSRIGVVPEALYYYRQRKEGISGSFSARNIDLLEGSRERLWFIRKKYPSLFGKMEYSFWNQMYSFWRYSRFSDDDEIKRVFEGFIRSESKTLFGADNKPVSFFLFNKCPEILPLYDFFVRIRSFIFDKRLKKICLPS